MRISALGHGLPLLSSLAKLRCVGPSTSGILRAGPSSCRTRRLSFGGDHGWPIGQDDRAWWCSWFRRTQAGQGTQTPHPGRHLGYRLPIVSSRLNTSDRRAGALLLGGLSALSPRIRTVIADAGHESRKFARTLKQNQGRQLRIVNRRQRAFKITGLTWIVERSFAWLGRNRRLSKDYEYWCKPQRR
jgi:transposase